MRIVRPQSFSRTMANFPSVEHGWGTHPYKRHMGVRRPSNSFIHDERYQLQAFGTHIRAAGAAQNVQRGS